MINEPNFLDNPRPEGRLPIPHGHIPLLEAIFSQTPEVEMVLAFKVWAEGVMRSEATFGIWLREDMNHEDKLETMRQLAQAFHVIVEPNYYLDLMLISPRDRLLWQMAVENGDIIYVREEEAVAQQLAQIFEQPPIADEERDIEVLRVL
ncbi:MAG: hypothetical protein ABDI19_11280 [Armatimonadota bacterium]